MKPFRPLFGNSEEERKKLQDFELMYPPQLHPVVRIHPISGRKVLFVNPQFTVGINGMEEQECRVLLDLLFRQALVPEYQFRLHWAPHTIAVWDNRSTQHYAVHDYYPQRRYMERVTIKGGPVSGVPRAELSTIRRLKYEFRRATEQASELERNYTRSGGRRHHFENVPRALRANGPQPAFSPPFSAGCRAVRFDMRGIDHLCVRRTATPSQFAEQVLP